MRWTRLSLIPIVPCCLFFCGLYPGGEAGPARKQEALRFSHRLHLTLEAVNCETCHVSAGSSELASDDILPQASTCLGCHNGVRAARHSGSEDFYRFNRSPRLVLFNHRQHLELGNLAPVLSAAIDNRTYLSRSTEFRTELETANACQACHRGLREVDATGPHSFPQMADCLVCHAEIEPPFSCERCHPSGTRIKPESHTPDFIDVHSSGKANLDKATCTICHGRNFRCMGCH
ncbi:MAG: hypothetical protein AB1898_07595 [Acidobacteriota bacterium]